MVTSVGRRKDSMTPGHLKRRGRLDICTKGLRTNACDETCEQIVLRSTAARQRDAHEQCVAPSDAGSFATYK